MTTPTHYSPFATSTRANPYPVYDWLRQEQPVYDNEKHEFWVLSRYEDIVRAARTPEMFSSAQGVGLYKRYGGSAWSQPMRRHIQAIIDDFLDQVIAIIGRGAKWYSWAHGSGGPGGHALVSTVDIKAFDPSRLAL